jgi:hypothetical protein
VAASILGCHAKTDILEIIFWHASIMRLTGLHLEFAASESARQFPPIFSLIVG